MIGAKMQPELFPAVAEPLDFCHLYEVYNVDAHEPFKDLIESSSTGGTGGHEARRVKSGWCEEKILILGGESTTHAFGVNNPMQTLKGKAVYQRKDVRVAGSKAIPFTPK